MRTKGITLGWLVGAAARKAVGGAMTAAALLFAGCSSEDDTIAGEPKTTEPTAQATVIRVTVGAGISDGEATTRSTVVKDGSTRTLQFSAGDKLYVWRELAGDVTKHLAGELTMKDGSPTDGGTQASFEGELTVYDDKGAAASYDFGATNPLAGSTATLLHAGMTLNTDYSIDGATKAVTFADATGVSATVEALMTKGLVVSGLYDAENDRFPLAAGQPILSCTIAGLKAGATYTMTYSASIDDGTYREHTTGSVATDASGTATFACFGGTRLYDGSQWVNNLYHRIRLTNAADEGDTYTVSIGQKEFEGKVYNVSRKWTGSAFVKYVNLTGQTGDVTVKDGYTVEGTLSGHQLLIADGATVTLSGASVTGPEGYDYGAIRCLGDATIILTDGTTNTALSGLGNKYAAVSVPEGKTLTINGGSAGTGTLTADARVEGDGNSRAGIGGGAGISCGKITITGGTVTAYGNNSAAGIGGGYDAYFDDISISGGTVTATGGSDGGAGIGSNGGYGRNYGNIRIEGGNVTATGGSDGGAGIGSGIGEKCGSIYISGGTVRATGGAKGAGIGSGKSGSVRGNISIEGGNVSATGGSDGGAGIGSGKSGSVSGNITITDGADYIYAEKSGNCRCIGKGESGNCGTVTIDGLSIYDYMYEDEYDVEDFTFPNFNLTLDEDRDYKTSETWTLTKK